MASTRTHAVLIAFGGMLLVAVASLSGIFFLAKVWPFPRAQGFSYVAHAPMALGFGVLCSIVCLVAGLLRPAHAKWWLVGSVLASWCFSLIVWSLR